VIQELAARLAAAGCVAAEDEAEELATASADDATLEAWVRRRERGEPLAWIIGSVTFCSRALHVDRGVYVPRAQSEELARRAAALLASAADEGTARAADLCTGAGAVAAHLLARCPRAAVVGVDSDDRAVECAGRNGVHAVCGDLDRPLRSGAFHVVTAVAPYVPLAELRYLPADVQRYEPRAALAGGDDGLDVVRRVVVGAARILVPGGWLLVELGGDQDRVLRPTLDLWGFEAPTSWCDEDGDLRGLAARLGER
jgi:release factor glutamine methyltransferase